MVLARGDGISNGPWVVMLGMSEGFLLFCLRGMSSATTPLQQCHTRGAACRLSVFSGAARPEVGWFAGEGDEELPMAMPPSRGCLHMYLVHPQDPEIQT